MTPVEAAYAGMSVLLVLAGAALMYPAIRGIQAVVYRRAVLALGANAVLFVVGWLLNDLVYHDIVDSELLNVVSMLVLTASAALHFVAVWLFARDFVQFEPDNIAIGANERNGGFDSERE